MPVVSFSMNIILYSYNPNRKAVNVSSAPQGDEVDNVHSWEFPPNYEGNG